MQFLLASVIVLLIVILFLFYNFYIKEWMKPIVRAEKYLEEGDKDKALGEFLKELESNPTNLRIRLKVAELLEEKGRGRAAKEHYMMLIGNTEDLSGITEEGIMLKIADINYGLEDYEEALRYYLRHLDLVPGHYQSARRAGKILYEQEEFTFAISYLEQAKSKDQSDPELIKELSFCYYLSDQFRYAIPYFENALKSYSNAHALRYPLAFALAQSDMEKKAAEEIGKMIKEGIKYPYRMHLYRLLANILYKHKHKEDVLNILSQAVNYLKQIQEAEAIEKLKIDLGFYHYFSKEIDLSIEQFESINKELYPYNDLDAMLNYTKKMKKIIDEKKKLGRTSTKSELEQKQMLITNEEEGLWEKAIENWEKSIISKESIIEIADIDTKKKFDVRAILNAEKIGRILAEDKERKAALKKKDDNIDPVTISKIYDYPLKDFSIICSNVVRKKFEFSILEEFFTSNISHYVEGDGVDFICYSDEKKKEDLIMVSFRRWQSSHVGEIGLRDYFNSMEEKKVDSAYLVMTSELTKSAKNIAKHTKNLKVYEKKDFAALIRGEVLI